MLVVPGSELIAHYHVFRVQQLYKSLNQNEIPNTRFEKREQGGEDRKNAIEANGDGQEWKVSIVPAVKDLARVGRDREIGMLSMLDDGQIGNHKHTIMMSTDEFK